MPGNAGAGRAVNGVLRRGHPPQNSHEIGQVGRSGNTKQACRNVCRQTCLPCDAQQAAVVTQRARLRLAAGSELMCAALPGYKSPEPITLNPINPNQTSINPKPSTPDPINPKTSPTAPTYHWSSERTRDRTLKSIPQAVLPNFEVSCYSHRHVLAPMYRHAAPPPQPPRPLSHTSIICFVSHGAAGHYGGPGHAPQAKEGGENTHTHKVNKNYESKQNTKHTQQERTTLSTSAETENKTKNWQDGTQTFTALVKPTGNQPNAKQLRAPSIQVPDTSPIVLVVLPLFVFWFRSHYRCSDLMFPRPHF